MQAKPKFRTLAGAIMLAKAVKELPAHRCRISGTIVRVEDASDNNNGPLNNNSYSGEPGLNAKGDAERRR